MSSVHLKKKRKKKKKKGKVFSNSLMVSAESSVPALVLASSMEDFKIISIKPRETMHKV